MKEQTNEIVSRIWEESRARLKNFIARKIENPADVEDVLQNVFFKIHQNIHQLKNTEKLYSWVYQLARNAIIDYYRQTENHRTDSEELLSETAAAPAERDVEEQVLNWLTPMIGDLPDKHREALLLTDIRGLTQREFAEQLDLSFSGAKSRVQRARDHLKNALLECCHLEFNRAGRIVEYKQKKDDCRVCPD
jgi:RNA polymerase sigma-70 factor, ECF subfamily